jgi:hypothetical protein
MLTIDAVETLTNGRLEVTFIPCPECGMKHKLMVRQDDFEDWLCGKPMSQCFPGLLEPQKELFVTGIDGECWTKIFLQGET